jgi:hypothetical protein
MSRGLTAGQLSTLAELEFRVETLVEIYLADNSWFYTTGDYAVSVSTATSGGTQSFNPRSFIAQVGSIKETFEASPNTLDLQFSRMTTGGSDDLFTNYLNNDIIRRRVVVYKLFRAVDTFTPDTTNGLIQIFDGNISGMDIETTKDNKTYTIRCTSEFGEYDKVKGRSTANIFGALQDTKIYWGSFYLE